jgi:hypothetical protein
LPANASVCVVDVDDPYQAGEKISVVISLRDDVLARWRGQHLIDEAQFQAGRRWQQLYQWAQIGALKSVDLERPTIDYRPPPEIAPKQLTALRQLAACAAVLGRDGDLLVRHVLGHEMSVAQATTLRGLEGARQQNYIAHRLRECLECLTREFRLA